MTPTTPTRATNFLTGLSTLLLIVTIAFGAFVLVGAIAGFGPSGDEVAVHTKVDADRVTGLPPNTVSPNDINVTVRVRDASTEQLRWAALRDLTPGTLMVIALWLLRGLLKSVREGDPFTEQNVRRLRGLGLVVLIGAPLAVFASSLFANELSTSAGFDSTGTQLTMPSGALLGGLVAFVLAEVFAAGVRLRDDVEGTV